MLVTRKSLHASIDASLALLILFHLQSHVLLQHFFVLPLQLSNLLVTRCLVSTQFDVVLLFFR